MCAMLFHNCNHATTHKFRVIAIGNHISSDFVFVFHLFSLCLETTNIDISTTVCAVLFSFCLIWMLYSCQWKMGRMYRNPLSHENWLQVSKCCGLTCIFYVCLLVFFHFSTIFFRLNLLPFTFALSPTGWLWLCGICISLAQSIFMRTFIHCFIAFALFCFLFVGAQTQKTLYKFKWIEMCACLCHIQTVHIWISLHKKLDVLPQHGTLQSTVCDTIHFCKNSLSLSLDYLYTFYTQWICSLKMSECSQLFYSEIFFFEILISQNDSDGCAHCACIPWVCVVRDM